VTTQSSSTPAEPKLLEHDLLRGEEEECLATFWRQATPGGAYVRCLLPARALPGQSVPLEREDLYWDQKLDQLYMPKQRGAAVWQFLGDDWRSRIVWALQDQGVRTLMEVDDNYTRHHPHVAGQAKAWYRTIAEATRPGASGYSNEMHRLIIPTLDGVIVSTEYLRDVYLEYTDHVFHCPNTVDPADWEDLEEKPEDVLRIVYSGSQSHLRDAPQVNKALKWASRQKGVEVWLQGVNPIWGFATNVPWTDTLSEYRRKLGAFHVGVAPLIPGEWANGKSDLKALEYAMAGVVPLVAREEPYRPWWDTDFDVEATEAGWLERIKWIVRNQDAIPELLQNARDYVLEHRTIGANIWRWKEALDVA
jgi:hypothetical protein